VQLSRGRKKKAKKELIELKTTREWNGICFLVVFSIREAFD